MKKAQKTQIGIGHMVRAMQREGFGHDEIMAFREAMITKDFSKIQYVEDAYTAEWDQSEQDRIVK